MPRGQPAKPPPLQAETANVQIRLPVKTIAELRRRAHADTRTLSSYIRVILDRAVTA